MHANMGLSTIKERNVARVRVKPLLWRVVSVCLCRVSCVRVPSLFSPPSPTPSLANPSNTSSPHPPPHHDSRMWTACVLADSCTNATHPRRRCAGLCLRCCCGAFSPVLPSTPSASSTPTTGSCSALPCACACVCVCVCVCVTNILATANHLLHQTFVFCARVDAAPQRKAKSARSGKTLARWPSTTTCQSSTACSVSCCAGLCLFCLRLFESVGAHNVLGGGVE